MSYTFERWAEGPLQIFYGNAQNILKLESYKNSVTVFPNLYPFSFSPSISCLAPISLSHTHTLTLSHTHTYNKFIWKVMKTTY